MANETSIFGRHIQKHDVEANWIKAGNAERPFIPKQAEFIVYDVDENYDYERYKIGDGINSINNLPFFKGDKGDPGYSPVRGIDYWTEEDKNEMKAYIRSYIEEVILGGEW